MKRAIVSLLACLPLLLAACGDDESTDTGAGTGTEAGASVTKGSGIVVIESAREFQATYQALTSALEENPDITLVAEVDHAENAASADLGLDPTRVVIFGNPKLGTPLMQASRTAGIDLPQKILVWRDGDQTLLAYNDPAYLASRHGIDGEDETLSTISGALAKVTAAAGGGEGQQTSTGDSGEEATGASGDGTQTDGFEQPAVMPQAPSEVGEGAGLTTIDSSQNFDETLSSLTSALEANPDVSIVSQVDHADNASAAGLELPATQVVIFGNPKLGTPLMAASPTAGLDLPQSILVWEDGDQVKVTYEDPAFLATRHGIEGEDETLDTISGALEMFATEAAGQGGSETGTSTQ
ncbi:MAG: DUF302 domain-containing protein [Solirubrobacterales bacterium]